MTTSASATMFKGVASTTTHSTAKEHLEYFVRIAMETSTAHAASLINFFNIGSLIILISLTRITKNFICFTNIFKHLICMYLSFFIIVLMLVGMPFQSCFPICLLDFIFVSLVSNFQQLIIVFALWFLQFKPCFFDFVSNAWGLWIHLLHSFVVSSCFFIVLHLKMKFSSLHQSFNVFFVDFDGFIKIS